VAAGTLAVLRDRVATAQAALGVHGALAVLGDGVATTRVALAGAAQHSHRIVLVLRVDLLRRGFGLRVLLVARVLPGGLNALRAGVATAGVALAIRADATCRGDDLARAALALAGLLQRAVLVTGERLRLGVVLLAHVAVVARAQHPHRDVLVARVILGGVGLRLRVLHVGRVLPGRLERLRGSAARRLDLARGLSGQV